MTFSSSPARTIGYARVSTGDQGLAAQVAQLKAAGCSRIVEETASGGSRKRPALSGLLAGLAFGDRVVVVRLDRIARSLPHLLEVVDTIGRKGATFRSLGDPVDTGSPQGTFVLQVLGAVAEFERALIRERTLAGLAQARAEGRVGGNPKLRNMDEATRIGLSLARQKAHFEAISQTATIWVPIVRRYRPGFPWPDVARLVSARMPAGAPPWSADRIKAAARRFVAEDLLPDTVLDRARPRGSDRLTRIVAGLRETRPDASLADLCAALTAMGESPPRGAQRWWPSTVRNLLARAARQGLLA
jgi:DNA invertase Pin-like site-specific DNA recombinase